MAQKVLIVEDNPIAAKMWLNKVAGAGYEAQVAETGQEARASVRAWQPDAVLLDMFLPETDGLTLCREWKEDPVTTDMRIVFVSAFHSRRDIATAIEAGADAYVAKSPRAALSLVPALARVLA